MITGFNTDVDYEGRVFHVQTEDKGRANPVVESLVYSGGEIVASRRASYAELARSSHYSEAEVLSRMEKQHQALIRDIRNGRFDPEGPKPFGHHLVTNRSLDEVVLEFLAGAMASQAIGLEMETDGPLVEGTRPTVRVRVLVDGSSEPLEGALVTVKLVSTLDRPRDLFAGETGTDGALEFAIDIPAQPGGNAAVLIQAEAGDANAEIKHLVRKAGVS